MLLCSLAFASAASSQTVRLTTDTTLFTIRQESIPPVPDSGGRWMPVTIVVSNNSAYPVHIPGFETHLQIRNCGPIAARIADSAFLFADSIFIVEEIDVNHNHRGIITASHATPWKYKDSVMALWDTSARVDSADNPYVSIDGNIYCGDAELEFVVPPHGTLRVPYLVQAILDPGVQSIVEDHADTVDLERAIFSGNLQYWFSDSTTSNGFVRRMGDTGVFQGPIPYPAWPYPRWINIWAPAVCSGPYIMFDTTTLSNKRNPAVLGKSGSTWTRQVVKDPRLNLPYNEILQTTRVAFEVTGEYSDRFILPTDSILLRSCPFSYYSTQLSLSFTGAPKTVVHDTLISTSTDCWGTVVTRTPIEAYTLIQNLYQVHQLTINTTPFLGRAYDTVVLSNLSDVPIELKKLQMKQGDTEAFQLVSVPTVVPAHDSSYIIFLLTDNNFAKDTTLEEGRIIWISGSVVPYQQNMSFSDSVFSLEVMGNIDVWCPVDAIYRKVQHPKIKHGIHPTGIIFPSDVKSAFTGPKSFIVYFGNFDSTSEYFYVPYFDDSHLQIAILNDGFGSYSLPGLIPPTPSSPSSQIQAKITFTGDDYHNYLTQLHWPRANDTVTIDVMVVGTHAPPFSSVHAPKSSSSFSIWPNPALSVLHIVPDDETAGFAIYDIYGREAYSGEASSNAEFDISKLAAGFYTVVLNSRTDHAVTQKLSIVR